MKEDDKERADDDEGGRPAERLNEFLGERFPGRKPPWEEGSPEHEGDPTPQRSNDAEDEQEHLHEARDDPTSNEKQRDDEEP